MNLKFLPDSDLMYVYFETNTSNTQTKTQHAEIFKFVAKSNKNKIIGYEIEKASKNLNFVLTSLNLNSKQKLAVCLFYIRERQGKTQKEFSAHLNVSESTYKSLERAEHNINFDTLDVIFDKFPDESILETVFSKAG